MFKWNFLKKGSTVISKNLHFSSRHLEFEAIISCFMILKLNRQYSPNIYFIYIQPKYIYIYYIPQRYSTTCTLHAPHFYDNLFPFYWTEILNLNIFTRKLCQTIYIYSLSQFLSESWFIAQIKYIDHSTEYIIQSTEYRVQSTEYKEQSTEHREQSTDHREQSTEYRI